MRYRRLTKTPITQTQVSETMNKTFLQDTEQEFDEKFTSESCDHFDSFCWNADAKKFLREKITKALNLQRKEIEERVEKMIGNSSRHDDS